MSPVMVPYDAAYVAEGYRREIHAMSSAASVLCESFMSCQYMVGMAFVSAAVVPSMGEGTLVWSKPRKCPNSCSITACNCVDDIVAGKPSTRSEEHTSELQSRRDLVC